jgi:drug/metabolite transporter (DMT)-like permease
MVTTARGTRTEAFGPVEWSLLAAIALMWGSSFFFIAEGLESFRPALVAFLRIAFGAATLAMFPRSRIRIERSDWPRVLLLGLVWMAIPLELFPLAQHLGVSSSAAGMINGGMPLFAALFAWWLLRRPPGGRQAIGLAVGFAGVSLVTLPAAGGAAGTLAGAGLALLATVLYGLSANIAVPLQQRYGSLPWVWRAQLVAVAATLPFGLASVPGSSFSWAALVSLLVLGAFGTGLAFVAMSTLVGRAGATRGAVGIYFLPVVALVLGVVFRNERVAAIALVGVALVLLGAWLTSRRETPEAVEAPPDEPTPTATTRPGARRSGPR